MAITVPKVEVVLKLPRKVPDLIVRAKTIVDRTTGNPWFPSPVPPLAEVRAANDKAREAEVAGLSMMHGLKNARNHEVTVLIELLNQLRAYVQGVANANPDSAVAIVESAGMYVKARALVPKVVLAVHRGPTSDAARLVSKAVAKVARYEWQVSEDGAATWTDLRPTAQANTSVSGLVPGKTYWFRMRAIMRHDAVDWCDPVPYLAH